jgi:hypothetical protein
VIISLEDGPTTPDSRLYFYVGQKQSFGTGLHRNGLDNGRLYVFAAESGPATEAVNGAPGATVQGEWKLIPNAETLNETQLETAATQPAHSGSSASRTAPSSRARTATSTS